MPQRSSMGAWEHAERFHESFSVSVEAQDRVDLKRFLRVGVDEAKNALRSEG
jgi:hypothetical protein